MCRRQLEKEVPIGSRTLGKRYRGTRRGRLWLEGFKIIFILGSKRVEGVPILYVHRTSIVVVYVSAL